MPLKGVTGRFPIAYRAFPHGDFGGFPVTIRHPSRWGKDGQIREEEIHR